MGEIGFITFSQLATLEKTGADPKEVVDRLLAEAKARHPGAGAVVIDKQLSRGGFAILAERG